MAIIRVIPAGDLALVDGDVFFVDGPAETRQRIASRFKFFLGEWFLDTRQGVPYFRDVFVKNPNLTVIRSLFRKILAETPGVLRIDTFELFYDASTRFLTFNFHATVEGGVVKVTEQDRDFLVAVDLAA